MLRTRVLLPLVSVLLVAGLLVAQAPNTDDLILVPVMVSDNKDVPVNSLKEENFQVLEDNKEQKIAYFSGAGDPIIVATVLGLSARGPVTSAGQRDRISVDIMNAVERVRQANTGAPGAVVQSPLDSDGMFKVVSQALSDLGKQPGSRKALVVVSDGLIASGSSASSVQSPTALIDAAKVSRFPIYFIFTVRSLPEPALTEDSTYGTGYFLQQVAEYSGGRMIVGQIETNLDEVSTNLRNGLKNQYVLGFKTTNTAKDGKWRKLTVKVNPTAGTPKLKVSAKSRYFVPKG